jgi:hypothetical protein
MSLLGDRSASFIVRVWREQGDHDSAASEWRGSIEHVGSTDKVFFRDLRVIVNFLKEHLTTIGIDVEQRFWEVVETPTTAATTAATTPLTNGEPRKKTRSRR